MFKIARSLKTGVKGNEVPLLHRALAKFGFDVPAGEVAEQRFGFDTEQVVIDFQRQFRLQPTGRVGERERLILNRAFEGGPGVEQRPTTSIEIKVRGQVLDDFGRPIAGATVQAESIGLGEGARVGRARSKDDGSYALAFDHDLTRGLPSLRMKAKTREGQTLTAPLKHLEDREVEIDITPSGHVKPKGSNFEQLLGAVSPILGERALEDLEETEGRGELSFVAGAQRVSREDLYLASLSARFSKKTGLSPEVFYSFLRQGQPPALGSDTPRSNDSGEEIAALEERILGDIIGMEEGAQRRVLHDAVSSRIVPRGMEADIEPAIERMKKLRQKTLANAPFGLGKVTTGQVLELTGLDERVQERLLGHMAAAERGDGAFWTLVGEDEAIDERAAGELRTTLALGSFSKNHIPFMKFARSQLDSEMLEAPGRLAALSREDWEILIRTGMEEGVRVIPDNIDGESDSERVAAFAEMLVERSEWSSPALSLAGRISRNPQIEIEGFGAIEGALFKQPTLDLRRINIDGARLRDLDETTMREMEDDLRAGVETIRELPEESVRGLKRMQRALRLVPTTSTAERLLATDFDAAHKIYRVGRQNFMRRMTGSGLSEFEARHIHAKASAQYALLMARLLDYRRDLDKAQPDAVAGGWTSAPLIAEIEAEPSLRTLFGTLDSCACEWCESAHGPAAYLTDLLRWLDQRDARSDSPHSTALEVLLDRRPDLASIKLNCQNADTPMPYIDLAIEVMEELVAPTGIVRNTTWEAERLLVEPEHVNRNAYDTLALAVSAPNLPFDLPHTEAAIFLAHLGLARADVMRIFRDLGAAPVAPSKREIAAAFFGLSPTGAQVIETAAASEAEQSRFWTFSAPGELVPTASALTLMARADIDYETLSELLQTLTVNGDEPRSSFDPEFECDLEKRRVTELTLERLDLFNRFLRLMRTLDWAPHELDLSLQAAAIGGGVMDDALLPRLMDFEKIRHRLSLDVETAVSLLAPINTRKRDWLTGDQSSLYEAVFLDPAVMNPADPDFAVAVVTAAAPPALLGDKRAGLGAALALSADDLAAILPPTADPDLSLPAGDEAMTLEALSQLYRYATVARALRVKPADLAWLARLMGGPVAADGRIDPFLDLSALSALLDTADRVLASNLSILETRHLLRFWAESPFTPSDELSGQRIDQIRGLLETLRAETRPVASEQAEALRTQLGAVPGFEDAQTLADAVSIIEDEFVGELAARTAFIDAHFGAFMDPADAQAAFAPFAGAPAERPAAISSRRQIALDAIYGVLARASVTTTLAAQLSVDEALADHLAWSLRRTAGQPTVGERLVDPVLLERSPAGDAFLALATRDDLPELLDDLVLVAKVALAAVRAGWGVPLLNWFNENAADFGLPTLSGLPVAAGDPPVALDGWLQLLRWTRVMQAFPEQQERTIRDVLSDLGSPGYALPDLVTDLALWSGRTTETIEVVVDGFGTAFPAGFRDIEIFERLLEALRLVRLAGVPAERLFAWSVPGTSPELAVEMKLAAKAKHSAERWLEVAKPLQDRLREAKRIALLSYLTTRPASEGPRWRDGGALFEDMLVDPLMTACRLSSRLVQATGSVQLFIQRCLLNLETDVLADAERDEDWNHFEWMKNYRVWEAARKVFLWPENFIRPELNTLKSPWFEEAEQQMAQLELTEETTEQVFETYLEKLDEASNLKTAAMHEEHTPSARILHVIARSRTEPPRWYYRQNILKKDATQGYWTPWKALDMEFAGSPVFGFVNRRLHLFWLSFTEKPDPNMALPPARESDLPPIDVQKIWELQLSWSVYRDGSWSAPRTGETKLIHPWFRPKSTFHLRTTGDRRGQLAVDIFVSTSPEFNPLTLRVYNESTQMVTTRRVSIEEHNEAFRPWHSSQFVFNGDVVEARLRNVQRFGEPVGSYAYVRDNYGQDGAKIKELQRPKSNLRQPVGMYYLDQSINNMTSNTSDLTVFRNGTGPSDTGLLLESAPAPFRIVPPSPGSQFDSARPFMYSDPERNYFVEPRTFYRVDGSWQETAPSHAYVSGRQIRHRFEHHYHPFSRFFATTLRREGVKGLFKREVQVDPPNRLNFATDYDRTRLVTVDHNQDIVDFGFAGAYSVYNWEIFFHLPFLMGSRLASNQRFDEALFMLRRIFDPTHASSEPAPARYWITKPFHLMTDSDYTNQKIERLLRLVNGGSSSYVAQVAQWRDNPFDPHLIARLRPVAYQRAVVMKTIEVLLEAGDQAFRRFSTESLNIATQYYVQAQALLGRRPDSVPVDRRLEAKSFNEIEAELDAFGNALAEVENTLPPGGAGSPGGAPLPPITIFYFCIPGNERLLDYWDRVERNLFNLRHCRDIEGVERQPSLFAPPIDPMLLVRAAAAGVDLSTIAFASSTPPPHYRFTVMLGRAYAFASEVQRLGSALLTAIEKRSSRQLELLRSEQQSRLRDLIEGGLKHRIKETESLIASLVEAKSRALENKDYYDKKSKTFMNPAEIVGVSLKGAAIALKATSLIIKATSSGAHAVPQFEAGANGAGGSPEATGEYGGEQVGKTTSKAADVVAGASDILGKGADIAFKIGASMDKEKMHKHLYKVYDIESKQIEKQLVAAEARLEFNRVELEAEKERLRQIEETETFLKGRFDNDQLFDWMVSQLSTLYFQSYKAAYDLASAAGVCAEREVPLKSNDYIKFGYWDSLRRGLLAGEQLSLDLRRLEAAYRDRNRRHFEIRRTIDLALLDPLALITLRNTGVCEFELPESLFDRDYPGHYLRRIKTASLTIDTGAASAAEGSVNATLTLLKDTTRISAETGDEYVRDEEDDDDRFVDNWVSTSQIVTSHGQDDSGLFELDLKDDRYLPFEGAGAISRWRLELPRNTNGFPLDAVRVSLNLAYTARDGGDLLSTAASAAGPEQATIRAATARILQQEFATEWAGFLASVGGSVDQQMEFTLALSELPYLHQNRDIAIVELLLIGHDADGPMTAELRAPSGVTSTIELTPASDLGGQMAGSSGGAFAAGVPLGDWRLKLRRASSGDWRSLDSTALNGFTVVAIYDATRS